MKVLTEVAEPEPYVFRILFEGDNGTVVDEQGNPVPPEERDTVMRRGIT